VTAYNDAGYADLAISSFPQQGQRRSDATFRSSRIWDLSNFDCAS
jgi:hypothetical protein